MMARKYLKQRTEEINEKRMLRQRKENNNE
jgi:hypothetical protein